MEIKTIKTSWSPTDLKHNTYIVEEEKECFVVDAGAPLSQVINATDAEIVAVFITHGHFDHIAGIEPTNTAEVLMHEADMGWVNNVNTYLPMVGLPGMEIPKIDKFINDGDIIKLGELEIKVIHTPGHTQGGVCFYVDGNLFSGDTIFRESVGRCDLEGGDFDQIVESIESKIFTLPPETIIYPGHGRKTTVEWEKTHNRFL